MVVMFGWRLGRSAAKMATDSQSNTTILTPNLAVFSFGKMSYR